MTSPIHTPESLTHEFWQHCKGQSIPAVVGAGLNIVFSALDSVDSPEIRQHFATSLRDMADKIETARLERVH